MLYATTSASWLNVVERFLRGITTQGTCQSVLTGVAELIAAIDGVLPLRRSLSTARRAPCSKSRCEVMLAALGNLRALGLKVSWSEPAVPATSGMSGGDTDWDVPSGGALWIDRDYVRVTIALINPA